MQQVQCHIVVYSLIKWYIQEGWLVWYEYKLLKYLQILCIAAWLGNKTIMQNMDSGIGSEFRKKCPIFGHLAMDLKIY